MAENKEATAAIFSWRLLAVSAISVVVATGVALLLIPQLSMRAAIRGGTIALGSLVFARLFTWWYLRAKTRGSGS